MSRFAYYILLLSSLSSISIINAQTPTNNPTSSPTTSAPTANFFWVNWSKGTCEDTQPLPSGSQYLLNTPAFLHPDLESCCAYHFTGEDYNDCITGGGGTLTGEDNWYVSYDLEACSKDCPIDPSTPECRGVIGKGTKTRYATEVACCGAQLSYIIPGLCQANSLGEEYTGSDLFYVDDSEHICLKDCETGDLCGGILTQSSRRTYDTIAECCEEGLPSITSEFCEAQSSGTDDGATDKWFAVSGLSYCKKDCTGTSNICDRAGPYDRLFDTSAECCTERFGWATPEYCQSRSEPGSVASGAYSNTWFASTAGYQDGLCVQDCDTSTTNPACSEDLNPSDQVFDTALECCQQKLSWLAEDSCADASVAGSREDAPATNQWYPDYAELRRCVKDCAVDPAEPSCAGKIDTVGKTMYDDEIDCCAKSFGWYDSTLCEAISLTGVTNTNRWYHPYTGDTDACVQDCEVDSSSPTCGGQPSDLGIKTFDTPGDCCDEKLSWAADCLFKSENGPDAPNTGSGKWYASNELGRCVKDCNDSSDDECGGLSEGSWNTLFDTSAECCDPTQNTRFSGQNAAETCKCQGLDPDDPVACPAGQGDGRWYKSAVSAGPSRCVTNCPTSNGDPCGGVAADWVSQFFVSAEACCNTPEFQQLNSLEGCVLGA